ncbi:MAG: pilus assembly PilX N-terminal domain-containing protein [Candidatus Moranbacteria bacterium]|nr:pilus assembly PilX N-terminal domain-containing protein [Candidatus Moranbacteria bacterium]
MIESIKIKNKKSLLNAKKGSALAMVLVMVLIIAITLTSLLGYISSQIRFSKDRVERERAFQIAEAGIYYYRWYLAHQVAGKTALQIKDFWETGSPLGVDAPVIIDYEDPESGDIGKYELTVQKPVPGSTIIYVKSTGWTNLKPSAKREIQVRFRRPSWSENSVLANDNMRFGQGTVVTGKIHSNKGIRFDGIANNIVSSSLISYDDPDHDEFGADKLEFGVHTHVNVPPATGVNDSFRAAEAPPNAVSQRADVFQAGRTFPAPQMDFTALVSDLAFMRSEAAVKYDNSGVGRRIILKADGTMDVCKAHSYSAVADAQYNTTGVSNTNSIIDYDGIIVGATSPNLATNGTPCVNTIAKGGCCAEASCGWIKSSDHRKGKCVTLTNQTIPDDGIVYVANNLWLEGTINNKKVSFVAAELSDEPNDPTGKKNIFLGMDNLLYTNTNGNDIIGLIAQDNVTIIRDSLDDLTIDAALLAKEGRVGRCYYDGLVRNSITVNGSIATNMRYGFAYTNGTGYQIRNINFDNNLLYYPPPYFPTGTEYAIDLWDEL